MPRFLAVTALGAPFRIDLSSVDEASAAAAAEAWSDAAIEEGAAAGARMVVPDAALTTAEMLGDLSQRVTLAAIEEARGRRWMLHAAGLADDDGRVVALIGPSGRGKTTASRVLGRRFGYVTDETVAVDAGGTVHPYRKPLSIIEDGITHPKAQRAPHTLGLLPLPEAPLRLGAIVLLDRRSDGPDDPVVEELDLGAALAELVAQTSFLAALEQPLRTVAAHASAVGGIRRVTYREAETLDRVLRRILDLARPDVPPAEDPPQQRGEREVVELASARRPSGARYSRSPVVDVVELHDPDRLIVLHVDEHGQGTVRVLSGLAPAIWRAAEDATLADLVDAAIGMYGTPDGVDPEALVAAAADQLVLEGVLRRSGGALWAVAEDVAWVGEPERAIVLSTAEGGGDPLTLEGSAAHIWHAVVAGGPDGADTAEVIVRAAASAGVERPEDIADDVIGFLVQLLEGGFVADRSGL